MKNFRRPIRYRGRFYNYEDEKSHGFFYRTGKMLLKSLALFRANPQTGQEGWIGKYCQLSCSVDPVVTWIGHASFLVQVGGVNILIDPIFGDVAMVYKRTLPPGISLQQMPEIDYVLISHNHIDHMDAATLLDIKKKNPEVTVLVPEGDKAWFERRKFKCCHEHTWWDQRSFELPGEGPGKIMFHFLPAAHWSRRGFFDKNKSLWGSWMIECCGSHIYFGGDSYYDCHFCEIAKRFSSIDIAMLPVGPCEPHTLLKDWHLDAAEAGRAFLDLGAKHMLPMHWGVYAFGVEHYDGPIKTMQQWWQKNTDQLQEKKLHCMKVGQVVKFGNNDSALAAE